ncbi:hypothetical protein ACP70R_048855 [Stipagrostis hirtigluma subsp. patula]
MLRFATLRKVALYNMQAAKEEPDGGKPPSFCDRLQRAFHARPAFRPLRRLTVRHQDGGAAKPAGAGAGAGTGAAAAAHGGPPVPAPPRPATTAPSSVAGGGAPAPAATAPPATQPVPVRAPTATAPPPGYPVPVPPPGVHAGAPSEDGKAGDKAQQTKGKTRVGSRVIKDLSSK